MKKIILLLLATILCFGVFVSCNDERSSFSEQSSEASQSEIMVREIISNKTVQLSKQDAELIEKMFNEGAWAFDITKTIPDYVVCFSGLEIKYSSVGIFNDLGSEQSGDERHLQLSEEETAQINAIIEKYFGETLD